MNAINREELQKKANYLKNKIDAYVKDCEISRSRVNLSSHKVSQMIDDGLEIFK